MFSAKTNLIFHAFAFIFVVCFSANIQFAQTQEQLKFYAERIEFGEIDVKRSALFDLRNFETEAASRIAIPALRDASEMVRATATHSVVFLPKDEAVGLLTPLLNEKAAFVRRETAYALGTVGSSNANPYLVNLLNTDKDREVRTASVVALGKIGDVSGVPDLNLVLAKKPKTKHAFLRRAAAKSIGQIAQKLQQQIKTETTPESFLPEKYKGVVKPKYRSLVQTFPVFRESNDLLLTVMRNRKEKDDVRREASFALGEIGDRSSIAQLRENLRSKDYYLVEISKEALLKVYASVNLANSDGVSRPDSPQK